MRTRYTTRYPGIRYRLVDEDRPDGSRRYVVGYTDATGKYRTVTLPVGLTLEQAKERQAALSVRKTQGETLVPYKQTVGLLLDEYIAARSDLSRSSLEGFEYGAAKCKAKFGYTPVTRLTANDLASAITAWKDEGLSGATIKKILSPLTGALKVAVREGWIPSNPADKLLGYERPKLATKQKRCLSSDEITKLLSAAQTDRWKALYATLVFTGLRIGEALALTWDDVDEAVHVRAEVEGARKTAAAKRDVMIIPALRTLLAKHRLSQAPGTRYVFAKEDGEPLPRHLCLKRLRAAEKKAGIPAYTLHELRHTFASILIANREPIALIADQMGHANPSVTLTTYAHLFDAQKNVEEARDRLQDAMGGLL